MHSDEDEKGLRVLKGMKLMLSFDTGSAVLGLETGSDWVEVLVTKRQLVWMIDQLEAANREWERRLEIVEVDNVDSTGRPKPN